MNRFAVTALSVLILILIPFSLKAQQFYISTELGLGIGNSLDTYYSDNDSPTLCDGYIDSEDLFDPVNGCSTDSTWENSFDGSTGIIAGAALGFSTNFGARIEAEYFNLGAQYDTVSDIGRGGEDIIDKSNQELARSEERIGNVNINSLFINVYYDLPVSGQLRPYIGGGMGFATAKVDYSSIWTRNVNPDAITTADAGKAIYKGSGDEATDRQNLHTKIAGTTTTENNTLEDTVLGYQAVIGVDYMLTESTSIGVKGRWVKYAEFSDSDEWDQLRSHVSNNGPGTDTVEYTAKTDDLSAWGVSLLMKYAF